MDPFPKSVCRSTCRFEGPRFVMRPFVPGQDEEALCEAVLDSLSELAPFLPWACKEYSLSDAGEFIASVPRSWESRTGYHFGIFDQNDGRLLGGVGLNMVSTIYRILNLGYWVRSSEAGRGLATEAGLLLADFALKELGALRLEILTAVSNGASRRVAEKMGAHFEGILRNRLRIREETQDAAMFSLIPNEGSELIPHQ